MKNTRRTFIRNSGIIAAAGVAGRYAAASTEPTAPAPAANDTPGTGHRHYAVPPTVRKGDMLYRQLGHTGEQVSLIGLGGAHIGQQKEEAASIRIIRAALDSGINFLDNCWDYNGGQSEIRMGKALKNGYRDKAFVMTKIDGRDKKTAGAQINESLKRLGCGHLDLLQLHEIIRLEDPDRIFAPGGAIEAVVAAREAGKIRHIGFTGHKDPMVHLRMIETADAHGFHFDTVQMPVNVMDAHFRSFQRAVFPVALDHKMGLLAMKTFGSHFVLDEVLASKTGTVIELLHYSMSQPVSVVITGIDKLTVLEQALEAARTFKPMSETEQLALLARVKTAALTGKFEKFKTTAHFDGTAGNPEWLGKPA